MISQPRAGPSHPTNIHDGGFSVVFGALFWCFCCPDCFAAKVSCFGVPCRVRLRGLAPCDLTPNSAESCPGLSRVQEEREAFLGKEMTPKEPPHKPGTCRKTVAEYVRAWRFKGLKNDCSFLWQLQWEPEEVTFEEILFTAAPGWERCVSRAELCSLPWL